MQAKLTLACLKAARSRDSLSLLAVSKTFPAEAVLAFAELGQRSFGENYLQEALEKQERCLALNEPLGRQLEWHFIGPIQSNKTRQIAENFAWVHSVDRAKIARRLIEQRLEAGERAGQAGLIQATKPRLHLCLQVNISGETSKSGCAPQELQSLVLEVAEMIAQLPVRPSQPSQPVPPGQPVRTETGDGAINQKAVVLRGLMCLPEPMEGEKAQRLALAPMAALMRETKSALGAQYPEQAYTFDTLSMGMSSDLQAAILEGSTIVRVGSALFGGRS